MSRARTIACLSLATAALIVAGVARSQAQPVTLRYFMWDPTQLEQSERALIAQFERENPNIKIQVEAQVSSDYWPKMGALAAARQLPDVFYMSSGFVEEFQAKGLIANLQPYVSRDIKASEYFTTVFSTARFPNKQTGDMYAFPFAWVSAVMYYNKDAFDAARVPYPTGTMTWAQFRDAAKKLTVDKNNDGTPEQWGYWFYGRYSHVDPWIFQNGGRILNANRTRISVDARATEALKFLTDLVLVDKVAPPKKLLAGVRQQDVFGLGQAAMWVDGSWNIDNNRKVIGNKFRWGITNVPRGPGGRTDVANSWPDMMAISNASPNKDAAWKFISFMTGANRNAGSFLAGTVPIHQPTANSAAFAERNLQPDNKAMLLQLGKVPSRTTFTQGWGEWRGYTASTGGGMEGEIDRVINGEKSLADAIRSITQYGNQVLTRVYPRP